MKCWGGYVYPTSPYGHAALAEQIPGISGATAIAAGGDHTCAIVSGGTVTCWGGNGYGELGDGTTSSRAYALPVPGLSGVKGIAVGYVHTCVITSDGAVRCWGSDEYGQLGDGNSDYRTNPVSVIGLEPGPLPSPSATPSPSASAAPASSPSSGNTSSHDSTAIVVVAVGGRLLGLAIVIMGIWFARRGRPRPAPVSPIGGGFYPSSSSWPSAPSAGWSQPPTANVWTSTPVPTQMPTPAPAVNTWGPVSGDSWPSSAVSTAAGAPASTVPIAPDTQLATPVVPAPIPAAPIPAAVPVWTPTHRVPAPGMPAWSLPNAYSPLAAQLSPGLEVTFVQRAGDWIQVRASNGWIGWVDGRLLVPCSPTG